MVTTQHPLEPIGHIRGQMSLSEQAHSAFLSRYAVFGHFYDVEMCNGSVYQFRSALELIEGGKEDCLADMRSSSPDCLVVMMNPGSSSPTQPATICRYQQGQSLAPKRLVATNPDDTQYRVMELMAARGWRHVRVLNISDLRISDSKKFILTFRTVEKLNYLEHSIFHPIRKAELDIELPTSRDTPIVLAWGVNPGLRMLAENAISSLERFPTRNGWKKQGNDWAYYHPLPRSADHQRKWVSILAGFGR